MPTSDAFRIQHFSEFHRIAHPKAYHVPMLRNIPQPGDAGRLELDGGVNATRDGAVDDGLLLLGQQCNDPTLGPNRPLQPTVRPVQKPPDGELFVKWRQGHVGATHPFIVDVLTFADTGDKQRQTANEIGRLEKSRIVALTDIARWREHGIRGADDAAAMPRLDPAFK